MTNRQNGERTRVMIVEQGLDFGIKLADWLATHGYQPVLFQTIEAAIGELSEIRPQAIFLGRRPSEHEPPMDTTEMLLLIQTICSHAPVTTIADQTREDLTQVVLRQGVRRFLVKPVEFSQIGGVLRSELSAATV